MNNCGGAARTQTVTYSERTYNMRLFAAGAATAATIANAELDVQYENACPSVAKPARRRSSTAFSDCIAESTSTARCSL